MIDDAAADVAGLFYGSLAGQNSVAEALRRVRGRFFETGDPTYLAYVFYGDVFLKPVVPANERP